MKTLGVLLVGAGAYLMFYAIKHTTNTPLKQAKTSIGKVSSGS